AVPPVGRTGATRIFPTAGVGSAVRPGVCTVYRTLKLLGVAFLRGPAATAVLTVVMTALGLSGALIFASSLSWAVGLGATIGALGLLSLWYQMRRAYPLVVEEVEMIQNMEDTLEACTPAQKSALRRLARRSSLTPSEAEAFLLAEGFECP